MSLQFVQVSTAFSMVPWCTPLGFQGFKAFHPAPRWCRLCRWWLWQHFRKRKQNLLEILLGMVLYYATRRSYTIGISLKCKGCHVDNFFISGCIKGCYHGNLHCRHDNLQGSQWWKNCQCDNLSVSVIDWQSHSHCSNCCLNGLINDHTPLVHIMAWH